MGPSPLSAGDRAELAEVLRDQLARLERHVAGLDLAFEQLVAAADLEPPDDEHDPDGTTAYERAQVTSMAAEARVRMAQVVRALGEVAAPGYGACERCGEPIGVERLHALPGTRTCIGCAARG